MSGYLKELYKNPLNQIGSLPCLYFDKNYFPKYCYQRQVGLPIPEIDCRIFINNLAD